MGSVLTTAADDLLSFIVCDFVFKRILPVGGICLGAFLFTSAISSGAITFKINIFPLPHNRPVLTLPNDCVSYTSRNMMWYPSALSDTQSTTSRFGCTTKQSNLLMGVSIPHPKGLVP